MEEVCCEVCIVGGSLGGVAATLAAGGAGRKVYLLSSSEWIGGQFASQDVCMPDENACIESGGASVSYQEFRCRIRRYYQQPGRISKYGANRPLLNPSLSWTPIPVEPIVGRDILTKWIASSTSCRASVNMDGIGWSVWRAGRKPVSRTHQNHHARIGFSR